MESRLKVIDKLRIDYEVPFVSDRGKILDHTIVRINERRKGVEISYALLDPSEQDLDSLFPRDGMDSLAEMTGRILHDLGVMPQRIALQMWDYSVAQGPYSVEGRAPVNKQRDTVLIIFTKSPFVYKFGYEMVLWHQAMHAKDRWERRFPAAHPQVQVSEWIDVALAFLHRWPAGGLEQAPLQQGGASGRSGGAVPQAAASRRCHGACAEGWRWAVGQGSHHGRAGGEGEEPGPGSQQSEGILEETGQRSRDSMMSTPTCQPKQRRMNPPRTEGCNSSGAARDRAG